MGQHNYIKPIPPRVLLVGPSFSGGGAEGHFSNIAQHLFDARSDVAVLVTPKIFDRHLTGEVIDLGWNGRLSYLKIIWRLVRKVRQKKYEVLMSLGFFPSVISIIALLLAGGRTKLIIIEITRPKRENESSRKVYNRLRRLLYTRSAMITANSIDGLKETCEIANVPVRNGVRVVNVIDVNRLHRMAMEELTISVPDGKFIVCINRLDHMKRIDTVLDAFAFLAGKTDCGLIVVGDGVARTALDLQVDRYGLRDNVIFTGMLDNPFPILARASAFVLASDYEGFSNSVLEAMFCDVPVITSLCSSDAYEMCARGAALGFEVGDYKHLAEQILTVVTNEKICQSLVHQAREYRTPHALENAIPFYESLICKVALF